MKKVYIKWEDIYSHDPWIQDTDALAYMNEPCVCETIGFLILKDKDKVVVCNSVNSENQFCGLMRIPRGCIKEISGL